MMMPSERERQIQEEIRRRILAAAKKREGHLLHAEETKATLDALADIVDLPREEMERIAKEVESDYNSEEMPNKVRKSCSRTRLGHFVPIVLGVTAFMLFKSGSSLYLLFGAATVVSIHILRRKKK